MKIIRLKLNKTRPAAPKRWIAAAIRTAQTADLTQFDRRKAQRPLALTGGARQRMPHARTA